MNLNVRAPKRPAPYDVPIARGIAGAGRPLPLAEFLDEKERLDPSWRATRRSFAPTFGMVMQVLKNMINLVTWIPTHIEFAVVGAVILVAVVADELVKRTVATRRARKSS